MDRVEISKKRWKCDYELAASDGLAGWRVDGVLSRRVKGLLVGVKWGTRIRGLEEGRNEDERESAISFFALLCT